MVGDAQDDDTWGWFIVCDDCYIPPKDHSQEKTVRFNIERLRQTNELGQTQNEMRDEIYENAREGGYDITRA